MRHLRKAASCGFHITQPLHSTSTPAELPSLRPDESTAVPSRNISSNRGIASLFQLAPGPLPQSSKSLIATYLAILVQCHVQSLIIVV
jgi:hypothetical protein